MGTVPVALASVIASPINAASCLYWTSWANRGTVLSTSGWARIALVALMAPLLAACTAESASEPLPTMDGFESSEAFLDLMGASGASDEQIAAAQRAIDHRAVELDVVKTAIEEGTFACLEQAGVGHSAVEITTTEWFPRPTYTMSQGPSLGEDDALRIADECVARHSLYLEVLYQNQPAAAEAAAAKQARVAELVRVCLEEEGLIVEESATADEVIRMGLDHDHEASRLCVLEADDAAAAEYLSTAG